MFLKIFHKNRKENHNDKKMMTLTKINKKIDNQEIEIEKEISIDKNLIANIEIVTIKKIAK